MKHESLLRIICEILERSQLNRAANLCLRLRFIKPHELLESIHVIVTKTFMSGLCDYFFTNPQKLEVQLYLFGWHESKLTTTTASSGN